MTDLEKFADLSLKFLGKEVHDLDPEDKNVLKAIAEHSLSSRDATDVAKDGATFGKHLSDRVAKVGGSWSAFTWRPVDT